MRSSLLDDVIRANHIVRDLRMIDTASNDSEFSGLALVRGFGGCAATHVEGTGPAHAFRAILVGCPWGVVTGPALVPRARL